MENKNAIKRQEIDINNAEEKLQWRLIVTWIITGTLTPINMNHMWMKHGIVVNIVHLLIYNRNLAQRFKPQWILCRDKGILKIDLYPTR